MYRADGENNVGSAIKENLSESSASLSTITHAVSTYLGHQRLIARLLKTKQLPEAGWPQDLIRVLLHHLSLMDCNNYPKHVGVGEREGRIVCPLVAERYFGFAHGIGRSGDISEVQPKAAGSALLQIVTNRLARDALYCFGLDRRTVRECLVVPLATGMSLALVLRALTGIRPASAKYVLWPRIDQKSCLKSMTVAGFVPVVVENRLEGDQVITDLVALEHKIQTIGPANILCVLSTTSCFAPRVPDRIVEISTICRRLNVAHVVNNAYGLQSSEAVRLLNVASQRQGRIDAVVQSTDKNFMVPVGGSIIASASKEMVERISKAYAGRASAGPVIDVFITLLFLGRAGIRQLMSERMHHLAYFRTNLQRLCRERHLQCLKVPLNDISMAISLKTMTVDAGSNRRTNVTFLGSRLFARQVSGARVVAVNSDSTNDSDGGGRKTIEGIVFEGYGSHVKDYPAPYLTVAAAIGISKNDIDGFIARLDKLLCQADPKVNSNNSNSNHNNHDVQDDHCCSLDGKVDSGRPTE